MGGLRQGTVGRSFAVPAKRVLQLMEGAECDNQIPQPSERENGDLFASVDDQDILERVAAIRQLMQESIIIGNLEWKRGSSLCQFDGRNSELHRANRNQLASKTRWRLPMLGELDQIRDLLGTSFMPQTEGDRIWTGDIARNSYRAKAVIFKKGHAFEGFDIARHAQAHLRLVRDLR